MTEALSAKPVFIDEMPDYQQAVRQIIALSPDKDKIRGLADDLGLSGEFAKYGDPASVFKSQAQTLIDAEQELPQRDAAIRRHSRNVARAAAVIGTGVLVGGALGAAAAARKGKMTKSEAILAGAGAGALSVAIEVGSAMVNGHNTQSALAQLAREGDQIDQAKQGLLEQQMNIGQEIVHTMAERMLAQRKMLVGRDAADMRLISTEGPQAMADKYAVPPAACKMDGVLQSDAGMQRQ